MRSNTNHGSSRADDAHVLMYSPARSERGAARWIHCSRSALTCLRGPMSWSVAITEQRHQKREKEQQRTSRSGSGAALSSERYFGQILRHNISSRNRVLDVVVADAPCVGVCRSLVLAPHSRLWHVGPIQTSAFVQQAPSCAFGGTPQSRLTQHAPPRSSTLDVRGLSRSLKVWWCIY